MITFKEYLGESFGSEQASRMGLSHFGFGRYGKNHKVTHILKNGRLHSASKVKEFNTLHGGQLKHLEHLDDSVFNDGHHGAVNALDHIQAMRHGDSRIKLGVKYDGSPSLVVGRHENGKHWVASKSAFNKDPKINYTDEDVDKNHGHAPGLAKKLKSALKHVHKLGLKKGQTIQADMLYDEEDKKETDTHHTFTPNTIKYSVDKNSEEGKKVGRSKLGLAIHTEYHNGEAHLNPEVKTEDHPDIYKAPVKVDHEKVDFDHHLLKHHESEIGKATKSLTKDHWDAITHPGMLEHVKTYINSKVRKGESDYSVPELIKHTHDKLQKGIDGVKTEKSKSAKTAEREALIQHVRDHGHAYKTAFRIQHHINEAKHHIIDKLNTNQNTIFKHEYSDGSKANPEGYVSIGHHGPLKFVNRNEFSRANFQMSQNR